MSNDLSSTLEAGFREMSHPDPQVAGKGLRDYQSEIKELAGQGAVTASELDRLVSPEDQEFHQKLGETVSTLLEAITYTKHDGTEVVLFQSGSSIVVIDGEGKLRAYYDQPLEDPEKEDHQKVKSYGPHTKWGFLNAGLSHVAHAQTGNDIDTEQGYAAATRAAKDLEGDKDHRDHDYASLPHLGSAIVGEGADRLYASTSGMLLEKEVIDDLLNGPEDNPLVRIAKAAHADKNVTGDFEGNILIGAVETMFSKAVLEVVLGQQTVEQALSEWDLNRLVEQDAVGINVH